MNKTLSYYNQNAEAYFERTSQINLDMAYPYLTKRVPSGGSILDLGAGSGRDSRFFLDNGYEVTSIDGSSALAAVAKARLNVDVDVLRFEDLAYLCRFDGVWASCSLLHLSDVDFGAVLTGIERSLKPGGYFYASFKYGDGELTDTLGRYFRLHNFSTMSNMIALSTDMEICMMERTSSYVQGVSTEWLHIVTHRPPVALTRLRNSMSEAPKAIDFSSLISSPQPDLDEVFSALAGHMVARSLSIEDVEACRFSKAIKLGSFRKGVFLKNYNGRLGKVIRDGYLDALSDESRQDEVILVEKERLLEELRGAKLQEELTELYYAKTRDAMVEEMADVLEVIECLFVT